MAPQIHLVRHAESVHNVSNDFSQPDPPLTPLGLQQAAALTNTFPPDFSHRVAIILTSPLRRAIQTTLAAFPHLVDKLYYSGPAITAVSSTGSGVKNGARLAIDPDLQERSALPCDTGSDRELLEREFPGLGFEGLGEGWQVKEGLYAEDDEAVEERARRVRERLGELLKLEDDRTEGDVVVVTHGGFMKFLSGDQDIDLPKAGWRSFTVGRDGEGKGEVVLVPVGNGE